MSDLIKLFGLILLIVLVVVIGPLLTIWALNTLFPVLAIPYTFLTWLAVVLLGLFIRSDISIKK
jgi:hypothetical protein